MLEADTFWNCFDRFSNDTEGNTDEKLTRGTINYNVVPRLEEIIVSDRLASNSMQIAVLKLCWRLALHRCEESRFIALERGNSPGPFVV
jgi:hypothetical protein